MVPCRGSGADSEWQFLKERILTLAHPMGDCRPSLVRVEFHTEYSVRKVQTPRRVLRRSAWGEFFNAEQKSGDK
jgi:hypothetical protein